MSSGQWTIPLRSIWECIPFVLHPWVIVAHWEFQVLQYSTAKNKKDEVITGLTHDKYNPHVCCLWGINCVLITHNRSQTLKESSCCFLIFLLVLLNRSDDSCLLCGGAVGRRDSDRLRMWGKRGACRVCPGQEGYSLLSAGGDGSAGPRLLPQLGRTS